MAAPLTSARAGPAIEWLGRDVSVGEIARELSGLRESSSGLAAPALRTSVMTHVVWAPSDWAGAALRTLEALGERHPSRTVVLLPDPDAPVSRLDATASLQVFDVEALERHVSTEVIKIWLRGDRAYAPASVVLPLLVSDLPVFLRWRGEPPFGADELEQLVDVADRMVVDSAEWPHLPRAYTRYAGLFERLAASDIAWRRTLGWRQRLAARWPAIDTVRELWVAAPRADALLLAGWLRSRLEREVRLVHEPADAFVAVAVDGAEVERPLDDAGTPSDLLSDELDVFARDPVFEAAVRAAR